MGFFDRFSPKRPTPATTPTAAPTAPANAETAPAATASPTNLARLAAAREKLELRDLAGAVAIYEEVLSAAGDRADVLVTISGDLGTHGHLQEIVELIAPRYDAERHGPATGLNVLQAYLALRNPEAAQHVLDVLFSLKRPELEDRLYGFSNAIAELLAAGASSEATTGRPAPEATKVALITISKPVWFYGLEPLEARILPQKGNRPRRVAFAQLAVLGLRDVQVAMQQPEDELGRLSRAIPLWLAETFTFAPHYAPVAAIGLMQRSEGGNLPMIFPVEWTTDNLRQLVDSSTEGVDYVFTGAIKQQAGDYELVLRVWEIKKFRERKSFTARWTPATADAELAKLHEQVRMFMEWSVAKTEFTYVPPIAPRAWLETLGHSGNLFLVDKNLLPSALLTSPAESVAQAGERASANEAASLAFLTTRARAAKLGVAAPADVPLAPTELVAQAFRILS